MVVRPPSDEDGNEVGEGRARVRLEEKDTIFVTLATTIAHRTAHVRLCAALLGEIFPHSVSPAENVTLIVSSKLQLNWNRTIYNRDDDVQQNIFKGTRETLGGAQSLSGCHPSGPALVPKTMYLRNLRAMQLYAYSDDINSRIYC